MKIIDFSYVIENGMPTCGTSWHENVNIRQLGKISEVGRNTHSILLGSHTGTHMDAPYHFIECGRTIESTPLDVICGEISIVDFSSLKAGSIVTMSDVSELKITERMLFRFDWFKKWKTADFYKSFPYFSEDAVDFLIKNGIKFMAMDTPSPDNGSNINSIDDSPNHKNLLRNNVVIVEYLTNTDLIDCQKVYNIYALPLKVKNSDGSPCRVILVEK